jgi:hypothetical protein
MVKLSSNFAYTTAYYVSAADNVFWWGVGGNILAKKKFSNRRTKKEIATFSRSCFLKNGFKKETKTAIACMYVNIDAIACMYVCKH